MNEILNSIWIFVQNFYIYILLGILLLVWGLISGKKKPFRVDLKWCKNHYAKRPSVLTRNEQAFYSVLQRVIDDKYVILSKV